MKEKDITRDFVHLSHAIAVDKDEAIHYQLVDILLNCLDDANYKEIAEKNLIACARTTPKIKKQLEFISKAEEKIYETIKVTAAEFFNKINTISSSINTNSSQVFFKDSSETNTNEEISEKMLKELHEYTQLQLIQINQKTSVDINLLQQRYQKKFGSQLQETPDALENNFIHSKKTLNF